MAGLVSSFIPGRMRLRCKVFRDSKTTAALEAALACANDALPHAGLSIEANNETGSILVTYNADALPAEDALKRRLAAFAASFPGMDKLRVKAAFYRPDEDREFMLDAVLRLRDALPGLLGGANS